MKFSYSLQYNTVPEWTEDYLSYGNLKKAIHDTETAKLEEAKGIVSPTIDATPSALPEKSSTVNFGSRSAQLETEFIRLFEEDAKRVATAFSAKKMASNAQLHELMAVVDPQSGNKDSDIAVNRIEVWAGEEDSLEKRRASLETSFDSVYLNLHDLHDFLDLNYTGYVKVVKNYGKYLHVSHESKRSLLSKIDSILPIAELSGLQNKMNQVEEVYARVMCDGSVPQARAALHLLLRDRVAATRQSTASSTADSDIMKSAQILPTNRANTKEAAAPHAHAPHFTPYRIGSIIGCTLLFLAIFFMPSSWLGEKIGDNGPKQKCLAILLSCTALWVTEALPLYVTALLIPALIAIFTTLDIAKAKEAWPDYEHDVYHASKFIFKEMYTDTVFLLLGGFSIAVALQKCGITRIVAVVLLKRFGKTTSSTLLTIMCITVIASAFVSNVTAPVLCFSLIQPILRGLDASSPFARALILGIAFAANIGGLASPIASPQSVISGDKLPDLKIVGSVSFLDWVIITTPIALAATFFCWIWLKFTYRSNEVLNFKEIFAVKGTEKPASAGKIIYVLAVFFITLVLWIAAPLLKDYIGNLGIAAVFPIVALFGAGILGKDDFNGFSWNVVFLAIGGTALGKGLDYSGLLNEIGKIVSGLLESCGYLLSMTIFTAILLFITTFVSHSVGAAVFLPIIVTFARTLKENGENKFSAGEAAGLVLAAGFTCSAGMAMPISGFPNMTAAAQQDRNGRNFVTTGDFVKGGVVPSIVFGACIVLFTSLIAPSLFSSFSFIKTA